LPQPGTPWKKYFYYPLNVVGVCGICGFVGLDDPALLDRMCRVIWHRGPDHQGTFHEGGVGLGNRRLAILDLAGGNQPIFNEEGTVLVVFNGEIYNFPSLRRKLEKKGHRFRTNCDTEVLVHLYEEKGERMAGSLQGMFAFAVYDIPRRRLVLGRDRAGIKPLHYTIQNGVFLFGSEIKSILQYDRCRKELDKGSLHLLLNLRFIPGDRTMFRGIRRLLPGHTLVLDGAGDGGVDSVHGKHGGMCGRDKGIVRRDLNIRRYWRIGIVPPNAGLDAVVKRTGRLFEEAVRVRVRMSDVPVGVFLSGGVDSSAVAAYAAKHAREPLKAFTIGFGDKNDEVDEAADTASHLDIEHIVDIYDKDLFGLMPQVIYHSEEPKITNTQVYLVSKLAAKHVKVVLSGMGGDEVFSGYPRDFHLIKLARMSRRMPGFYGRHFAPKAQELMLRLQTNVLGPGHYEGFRLVRSLASMGHEESLFHILQHNGNITPDTMDEYYGDGMGRELPDFRSYYRGYFDGRHPVLNSKQFAEFETVLVDDLLSAEDRTTMASSLEARVPFLDTSLVSYAFGIPQKWKIRGGESKYVLRQAVRSVLPKEVFQRPKKGFAILPVVQAERSLVSVARRALSEENIRRTGNLFNASYLRRLMDRRVSDKLNWHYIYLWLLVGFQAWYATFIEGDVVKKPTDDIYSMFA
jgi:asparagine synthase (glutamine-hydrolysing)